MLRCSILNNTPRSFSPASCRGGHKPPFATSSPQGKHPRGAAVSAPSRSIPVGRGAEGGAGGKGVGVTKLSDFVKALQKGANKMDIIYNIAV
jgi:hypothetical protein